MKPYYEHGGIRIFLGDSREIVPQLGRFDLLLTDPPYGESRDKNEAHSSIRDNARWPVSQWDKTRPSSEFLKMLLGVANMAAIWGGNYFADCLPPSSGWLVWRKPEAETGFSLADAELCWTSEPFSVRMKTFPRRDGYDHPTQKPVGVMRWTIQTLRLSSGTVLDPFMGVGTTLRACKDAGIECTGVETEERYAEIAARRLEQEVFAF